jgi:hypothetical protein
MSALQNLGLVLLVIALSAGSSACSGKAVVEPGANGGGTSVGAGGAGASGGNDESVAASGRNAGAGAGPVGTLLDTDKVDLLFMIDNSPSMADKQALLKDSVPILLAMMINPMPGSFSGNLAG